MPRYSSTRSCATIRLGDGCRCLGAFRVGVFSFFLQSIACFSWDAGAGAGRGVMGRYVPPGV
ncbi:hypothetical protein DL95DRAFT_382931 [Leptodontidium sp. 2 PMI_412]|nr:hypothetical protein DL95DRAFT_382931 [Leptodontidium sp. 2 PMI_412]